MWNMKEPTVNAAEMVTREQVQQPPNNLEGNACMCSVGKAVDGREWWFTVTKRQQW